MALQGLPEDGGDPSSGQGPPGKKKEEVMETSQSSNILFYTMKRKKNISFKLSETYRFYACYVEHTCIKVWYLYQGVLLQNTTSLP